MKITIDILIRIVEAIGALAAFFSLLWAIKVYMKTNDEKNFQQLRDALIALPVYCKQLNRLLSESLFAAIGNSIAQEMKPMFEGHTIESFSKWMLSEDSSNYKALSVYMGLEKCEGVKEIKTLLEKIESTQRIISTRLPMIGRAYRALLFYITKPANYCTSNTNISQNLKFKNNEENLAIKQMVKNAQATGSVELYFRELSIFITLICRKPLMDKDLGQQTLNLAYRMIRVISNVLCLLSDNKMKDTARKDMRSIDGLEKRENQLKEDEKKHSVQIAMFLILQYKSLFSENDWEKLIECKAQIIQLMEYEEEASDYR